MYKLNGKQILDGSIPVDRITNSGDLFTNEGGIISNNNAVGPALEIQSTEESIRLTDTMAAGSPYISFYKPEGSSNTSRRKSYIQWLSVENSFRFNAENRDENNNITTTGIFDFQIGGTSVFSIDSSITTVSTGRLNLWRHVDATSPYPVDGTENCLFVGWYTPNQVIGPNNVTSTTTSFTSSIATTLFNSAENWKLLFTDKAYFYTRLRCNENIEYVGTITDVSDISVKENLEPLAPALDNMLKFNPVSFNLKESGIYKTGFVAQEVEEIDPTLVDTHDDGIKHLRTMEFIPRLVKSIQEQQEIIQRLEDRIAELEKNQNI